VFSFADPPCFGSPIAIKCLIRLGSIGSPLRVTIKGPKYSKLAFLTHFEPSLENNLYKSTSWVFLSSGEQIWLISGKMATASRLTPQTVSFESLIYVVKSLCSKTYFETSQHKYFICFTVFCLTYKDWSSDNEINSLTNIFST